MPWPGAQTLNRTEICCVCSGSNRDAAVAVAAPQPILMKMAKLTHVILMDLWIDFKKWDLI